MGFLWKRGPSPPKKIPTDTVLPMPAWDDQRRMRHCCLHVTSRFDDVLSPEVLRQSLERLLQIDGWRTLGARLRMRDDGKLEYHLPAQYDAERPGFGFAVIKHAMCIKEHPLAARLPQATTQPSLLSDTADVSSICLGPDCPRDIDDWLYSDRPQLAIDVVLFDDATLLTVTFLHTLTDAMGLSSFMKAWTSIINGREDQVPAFHSVGEDPMAQFTEKTPAKASVNFPFLLTGIRLFSFILSYVFELLWYRGHNERVICIPGQYIDGLRNQALHDLSRDSQHPAPFLSESDILLAWWTKTLIKSLNPSPGRLISLLNVFDIRSTALPQSSSPNTALITNAALVSITFLRVRQILNKPVSFIASAIRTSLTQQRTLPQIEASFALQKSLSAKNAHPPMFGEANSLLVCCTNWNRGRFFEVDFSAAVTKSGIPPTDRPNALGRPSFVVPTQHSRGPGLRNIGPIIGKDAAGNWWLSSTVRTSAWAGIERELDILGGKKNR
ncbi:uncharacterized protein BJX67DRAFT_40832 [Aspergillus lucknowensis]|uniref:LysR family regulatory protein n=1 Tax=Aspergillus lucknowensis TaxID=176173 RepID=A0ABR4L5M7_9EURO